MLCASLLALSCVIQPSDHQKTCFALKSLRGGQSNDQFDAMFADRPGRNSAFEDSPDTTTAAPPSDAAGHLAAYADALADFMLTFQQLSDKAGRECKDRFWAASESRLRQRPDRQALQSAHRQIRELYHDAITHACAERQHLFAATTLRLHLLLSRLLREASPSSTKSSSSGAGADEDRPPPVEIVPAEEVAALEQLRVELLKKPKGTVADVLTALRRALETPAAAHLTMLYATLMETPIGAITGAGATTASAAPQPAALQQQEEEQSGAMTDEFGNDDAGQAVPSQQQAAAGARDFVANDDLEREVQMALKQAEEMSAAQQQSMAEAERQLASHAQARLAAEEAAVVAQARVAELEARVASGQLAVEQSAAASAAAGEEQLNAAREALSKAESEAKDLKAAMEEAAGREHQLQERLRLASSAAAQAQAAEGTARNHCQGLSEQLQSLQSQYAGLYAAYQAIEQQKALYEQTQSQAQQRTAHLSQMEQQDGQQPHQQAVPLQHLREVQLELHQLTERFNHVSHLHNTNLQHVQQLQADGQASRSQVAELTRRLEMADAQLQAANTFQPAPSSGGAAAVSASAGGGDAAATIQQGVSSALSQAAPIAEAATSKMKDVGGSLFNKLAGLTTSLQDTAKGLVGDLAGLVEQPPEGPSAATRQGGGEF